MAPLIQRLFIKVTHEASSTLAAMKDAKFGFCGASTFTFLLTCRLLQIWGFRRAQKSNQTHQKHVELHLVLVEAASLTR